VNFVSYYPYTPNITQKYKIPVDVSAYTGPLADMGLLVYDGRGVSKQKGDEAIFAYKPQLCKLIIVVKPEDSYEDVDLTVGSSLNVNGLPTKAKYNLHLSTMEIPTDKTEAGTDTDVSLTPVVTSKDSVRWEALILPHTPSDAATAGRFFTFTLGGKPYEYELVSETFVKGKKYRYDFTLSELQTTVLDGMTNSFMVIPGQPLTFEVKRAYNSLNKVFAETLRAGIASAYPHTFTTEVLWDDNGVISGTPTVSGSGNTARVTVQTTSKRGNAVVAIKVSGTIVWSYHIWVTDYVPDETNTFTANSGYVFMNRNLGARERDLTPFGVNTFGLLYQWGRKDPFPGSMQGAAGWPSSSNYDSKFLGLGTTIVVGDDNNADAIVTSIKNPQTFYSYKNNNDWLPANDNTLWNTARMNKKTVYDPCPSGWRVPRFLDNTYDADHSPWKGYASPSGTDTWGKWEPYTPTKGMTFGPDPSSKSDNAQYPAAGQRSSDGSPSSGGTYSRYWSASPYSENSTYAANFSFNNSGLVSPINPNPHAVGFSVRCVRE
jgi:uncharacterized protein (TIGR02145 family)